MHRACVPWRLVSYDTMLVRAPIGEILAGLTDSYSYHYQDRQH